MSTTGEPEYGTPQPDALAALMRPAAASRDEAIEADVTTRRVIGSPEHFDEAVARQRAAESYDRCYNPAGTARQLLAIVAGGSRAEGLAQLALPTLVIHGDIDPLVTVSGGQRTAELVPGAELPVPGRAWWADTSVEDPAQPSGRLSAQDLFGEVPVHVSLSG
jgi:pimeloyl-ACP methyl ester carboxylesterase